jgi:serine/threonine-protein kinase
VSQPHPQIAVGDVLAEKYRVERVLGSGGMGVVVAAQHVTLHHKVALKLMLPSAATDAQATARFLREARAAAQLRSEHVARVLDVGTLASGEPFMVMELLEGSDLDVILHERGPLPVAEAVDYLRQACDAVAEAHERGIVHRDLKPGNLFLASDARGRSMIKVLDFGISKHTNAVGDLALTKTAAIMGSPLYMSPEQMRASRDVDARTDVWSLGVTLYQLLAGRVPFLTDSPMELGAKVLHEEPEPLDQARRDVPPAIAAVVKRCLAKDPAARFAGARDLAAALDLGLTSSIPSSAGTRVLVTTAVTNGEGGELPFSRTSIAHSHTAQGTRRAPGRSLAAVAIALVVAAGLVLAVRARPSGDLRATAGADVRVAAPEVDAAPALMALAVPDAAAVEPRPAATALASASVPASAPTPGPPVFHPHPTPGRRGIKDAAPATPPPAPTPTSNPLDHL